MARAAAGRPRLRAVRPGATTARLEELRLAALEERIDADLAPGATPSSSASSRRWSPQHPLRERLRGQLMLALYRSGRQAEALEAYQAARRALVEELGIEPGRALRELQQAILRQDAELDARRARRGAERPTPRAAVFVGRERELAALDARSTTRSPAAGAVLLIAGEPGIGKSRLADELAAPRAGARGARSSSGAAGRPAARRRTGPGCRRCATYVRDSDPDALRAQLGAGAAELAQLLPELASSFPDLPEPPALESEGARFRLFEAVAAFLRRAAEAQPLVARPRRPPRRRRAVAAAAALRRARSSARSRLLIVGAYRDVDPTLGDPLTATLAELAREPAHAPDRARRARAERDVAEYIERHGGDRARRRAASRRSTPRPRATRCSSARSCGCSPPRGAWARPDAALAHPAGRARGDRPAAGAALAGAAASVLAPASVLGREFDLDALAQLAGSTADELLDVLDEALAARVVADVPGSPGRLRFAHALIRDTLYDDLTPRAPAAAAPRGGRGARGRSTPPTPSPHLAELAHHYVAAGPGGLAEKASTTRAAPATAPLGAARLRGGRAPTTRPRSRGSSDDAVARCELLLALGDARGAGRGHASAKATFRRGGRAGASAAACAEQLARAALGYGGRSCWDVSRDDDAARAAARGGARGASDEDDSPLRVRLLARLAGGPLRDAQLPARAQGRA